MCGSFINSLSVQTCAFVLTLICKLHAVFHIIFSVHSDVKSQIKKPWLGKAETYVGALDYTCGNTVHL